MHTSFPKGTTIWIKMKTGEEITGKFSDHKSGKVLLENGAKIQIKDVRAMSIRKLK
jgi:nitrogen fixation protein